MKSVLRISDGVRSYPFVYEDGKVYWPDNHPGAYGYNISYKFMGGVVECVFDGRDCLACAPFRYEGCMYSQYVEVGIVPDNVLITLTPWTDGDADPDWVSVQSAHISPWDVGLNLVGSFSSQPVPNLIYMLTPGKEDISTQFGGGSVSITYEVALMDDDDIYWKEDNDGITKFANFPIKNMFQWKEDMRFVGLAHVTVNNGDGNIVHVDVRGDSIPLTQQMCAFIIQGMVGSPYVIEKEVLDKMIVQKPRLLNKTIQTVVEMTAQTDSKANIVQPVFFRARELAQIVVHPEVTENICINLDAYKSQVSRFYIKIEGTAFPETGRVESGIVFKVQGSLLPGTVKSGTYYILNEDMDLVTTGKYSYES
jgi:hypothetical protein